MSEPQIYIRGFPKSTTEKDLEKNFDKFGSIKQVRIINAYAFIGFETQDNAKQAVREMNQTEVDGYKLKVQIAGKPRKPKGPQPNDQCRYCHKLGHWKNSCPEYRKKSRRRRYRSSSSSSSSSSERYRRKKRSHKRRHRRSPSSDSYSRSSSSSSSSSSSYRSREKKARRRRKSDDVK